jgi:hypothetical protein
MSRSKKISISVVAVVGAVGVILLLLTNTYTSSPGFTTEEGFADFLENKEICYGIDILLNEKDTWADAPGRSLCLGVLK